MKFSESQRLPLIIACLTNPWTKKKEEKRCATREAEGKGGKNHMKNKPFLDLKEIHEAAMHFLLQEHSCSSFAPQLLLLLLHTPWQISRGSSPQLQLTSSHTRASCCPFPQHQALKEHELPQRLWMSSKPSSSAQRELEPGPARRIWRAARLLSHRRHQSHPLPGLQVLLLPINSYSKPQSSPWTKTHSPASLINTNGNCPPRHLPRYDIQRKCKGVVQFILIYALD